MGLQLTPDEVNQRLADAEEHMYNPEPLGEIWGVQRKTAASWLRDYCRKDYYRAMHERLIHPVYPTKRENPEYENQRMFDMQVLDRRAWCNKWDIPLWEYDYYLSMYERNHGEIATPEIREQWDREYWEKM